VGIWLALGTISLASCAPVTLPGGSSANAPSQTQLGSESAGTVPGIHIDPKAPVDNSQSSALTDYLHTHQLPLVGARVLASSGGPRQAILYGYVATPFGKADALDKTRQWLNDSGAQVDNRIKIEPDLAGPAENPNVPPTADNLDPNNPDIQKYEAEQNRQQALQQQQYMNQGSPMGGGSGMGMGMGIGGGSPFSMFLPLLMGGGGSGLGMGFGGGGMGSGFGSGGGFGSPFGSPMGSPYSSPYGSSPYPSTPPPSTYP